MSDRGVEIAEQAYRQGRIDILKQLDDDYMLLADVRFDDVWPTSDEFVAAQQARRRVMGGQQ